jgi:hypothetical protein
MKADRSDGAPNRTPTKGREIDWVQAYEKRMRRFNMEVVLAALLALILANRLLVFLAVRRGYLDSAMPKGVSATTLLREPPKHRTFFNLPWLLVIFTFR